MFDQRAQTTYASFDLTLPPGTTFTRTQPCMTHLYRLTKRRGVPAPQVLDQIATHLAIFDMKSLQHPTHILWGPYYSMTSVMGATVSSGFCDSSPNKPFITHAIYYSFVPFLKVLLA
ncbi:hypothetical protein PTI98_010338 [Pleurotus ostreatus]|nr:hypothetical protein PTI98_010338 [Pleurotus ostreatus]